MEFLIKSDRGQWSLKKSNDDLELEHAMRSLEENKDDPDHVKHIHKWLDNYLTTDKLSKLRYKSTGEHKGEEPSQYQLPSGHTLSRMGRWQAAGDQEHEGTDTWEISKDGDTAGYVEVDHGKHKIPHVSMAGAGHSFGGLDDDKEDDNERKAVWDKSSKQLTDIGHHLMPTLASHYGYIVNNTSHTEFDPALHAIKKQHPNIDVHTNDARQELTFHTPSKVKYDKDTFTPATGHIEGGSDSNVHEQIKEKMLPQKKSTYN